MDIQALTLITSFGCNLKCAYCELAKAAARNPEAHTLQLNTINAFEDGSFLNNIIAVLKKFNQNPSQVDNFSFWGQEPTLTMEHFTNHFEDWYAIFPKLKHLFFSTNCVDYMDKIIDLIKKIDSVVDHRFDFQFQCSFDGEDSTNNLRKADSKRLKNNLTNFFKALNDVDLKYVTVNISYHGVVSNYLLNKLDTDDKIQEYFENLGSWVDYLKSINSNPFVKMSPGVELGIEQPIYASAEDGRRIAKFFQRTKHLNIKSLYTRDSLLRHFSHWNQVVMNFKFHSPQETLHAMSQNTDIYHQINKAMSLGGYCGNGHGELKIMYDGTLVNCQSHIFELKKEYIPDDKSIEHATKRSLVEHGYFLQPLNATQEQLDNYTKLFTSVREQSFIFTMTNIANMMNWLLRAGQIDESYKDTEKLMAHAFILGQLLICSYNNQTTTGSIYLHSPGFIRMFCNGLLDEVEAFLRGEYNEH